MRSSKPRSTCIIVSGAAHVPPFPLHAAHAPPTCRSSIVRVPTAFLPKLHQFGASSAQSRSSTKSCPIRGSLGSHRPNLAQIRPDYRSSAHIGEVWQKLAKFGRCRSMSADFADFRATSGQKWPNLVKVRQLLCNSRPTLMILAQNGPKLGSFGQHLPISADVKQHRRNSVRAESGLDQPNCAKVGQSSAQVRPKSSRIWPTRAQFGPNLAEIGPKSGRATRGRHVNRTGS